jgi:hypothetical protein
MIHERDSSRAVFTEVYSMYAITRRAIEPPEKRVIVDRIAVSGILPTSEACA